MNSDNVKLRLTINVDMENRVEVAFVRKLLTAINVLHAASKPVWALTKILDGKRLRDDYNARSNHGKVIVLSSEGSQDAGTTSETSKELAVLSSDWRNGHHSNRQKTWREIWLEQRKSFTFTQIFEQKMELDRGVAEELDIGRES